MRCPQKNHNCEQRFIITLNGNHGYICAGFNKKPTKYKHDIINLCLHGKYVKDETFEMTLNEALSISTALTTIVTSVQLEQLKKGKMKLKEKRRK